MLKFDNPFAAGSANADAKTLPQAGDVYAARRVTHQSEAAGGTSNASASTALPLMYAAGRRERRAGRAGFSIDPDRLEAYLRRRAGCRGMANKADDDRRKAEKALDAQKYQARRFIDNRQGVPADLVARIRELQVQADAAEANYAAVSSEIQEVLSIAERVEKYVDECKADDIAARRQESRDLQLDGDDE